MINNSLCGHCDVLDYDADKLRDLLGFGAVTGC